MLTVPPDRDGRSVGPVSARFAVFYLDSEPQTVSEVVLQY